MVPRYVETVDHLPKTQTLRVQKFDLRARPNTSATWDRATHDGGRRRDSCR
jgi:acyl-coenzyme A synthetase/AMP-(fatty) acid ligase